MSTPGPWANLPANEPPTTTLDDDTFQAAVEEIDGTLHDEIAQAGGDGPQARQAIAAQVRAWATRRATAGRTVPAGEQARLIRAIVAERFGYGLLQPYMDDDEVEEIDVNGPDQVWVTYAGARKVRGPRVAASNDDLNDKVRRWAGRAASAREFSAARPLLNVALEVGVRMAATTSVSTQTHVAIRKQRLMDITLADLVKRRTLDEGIAAFLAAAVHAKLDVVVTGGVSAGKTTFMRALCSELDPAERIITLESERELYLDQLGERHLDVVSYEAREANSEGIGQITLVDLIPQVLRMNPDRIMVGEVRHAEMLALLQAIDNGLEGSLCTLHANSGAELFGRILTLCAYSSYQLPAADLYRLIGRAIDLVVHVRRDRTTGDRYVSEIIEVLEPIEGTEPAVNRIYRPGPGGRATPDGGATPACIGRLEAAGFDRRLLTPRQAAAAPTSPWGTQQNGALR